MDLRETIALEVQRHGLPDLRAEQAVLERELFSLDRREGELRQSISLWDRWMLFTDTPAEAQLKASKRRRREVERSLRHVQGWISRANAAIGEVCPPFAVSLRLRECVHLAYTGLVIEGRLLRRIGRDDDLREALGGLADLLRATYFPALDFAALRRRLADARACQELAALAEIEAPGDRRTGVAPLVGDAPLGRIAERLLDNGYIAARSREDELMGRCRELAARHLEAGGAVSWWDRLNVFTRSPDELVRDQAAAELRGAQDALRRLHERQHALLHDAMRAYPPLDLYHGVVEALGIASQLTIEKEAGVAESGAVVQRPVIRMRPLLLAALRRLQRTLAAAFPGVPSPRELGVRVAPEEPGLRGHPAAAAFLARAGASRLARVRDETLAHAAMVGQVSRELDEVARRISLLDRLVFWSDTDDERAEDELAARAGLGRGWTEAGWQALLGEARAIGAGIGPLAARDAAVAAAQAIAEIHTDPGSSSFPKRCEVYGREAAIAALLALRGVFARIYGADGPGAALLAAAAAAAPAACEVYEHPEHGYEPLTPEQLHGLLAASLAETDFAARYQALHAARGALQGARQVRASAEQQISLWDRINIFSTTEAEARRDGARAEITSISGQVAVEQQAVATRFRRALSNYPPALLCVELDAVIEAVEDIRATCQAYTVTRGSGKNRRTETRYRCVLHGKTAAVQQMQRWSALMVDVFGPQLGYVELLEAFELDQDSEGELGEGAQS